MNVDKIIRCFFYVVGVGVFLFLAFVCACFFGNGQSIVDYYLSWRAILFLPFYVVSLVVMEFLYNKLNKLLEKRTRS